MILPCVVSPKEKEKKRNINNNLAILPSHDNNYKHYSLVLPGQLGNSSYDVVCA